MKTRHQEVSLTLIDRDPDQPRRSIDTGTLRERIWVQGLLHAIVLVEISAGPDGGSASSPEALRYRLLAGERRLTSFEENRKVAGEILANPKAFPPEDVNRASLYSAWTEIPAQIWPDNPPPWFRLLLQLSENDEQEPLNLLDRADAYLRSYQLFGSTNVTEFCRSAGIQRGSFYNFKKCAEAKGDLREALKRGLITDALVVGELLQLPADLQAAHLAAALRDSSTITRPAVQETAKAVRRAREAAAKAAAAEPPTEAEKETSPPEESSHPPHPPADQPSIELTALEWLRDFLEENRLAEDDPNEAHRDAVHQAINSALLRGCAYIFLYETLGERRSPPAIRPSSPENRTN